MEYVSIVFHEVYRILFLLVPVLVSVAMIVWLDRRVWAFVQKRQGPNVVGPFGLLQSVADALKYIFKEIIIPSSSNKIIFILAPIVTMTLALIAWAVIPFSATQVLADINVGILYLFAVSSLGVYGIIMGGWASNSKYPFLGSLRSAAQMISYEVSIGFVIITVLICVGSLNLIDIVESQKDLWFAIPLLPMFIVLGFKQLWAPMFYENMNNKSYDLISKLILNPKMDEKTHKRAKMYAYHFFFKRCNKMKSISL